MSSEFVDVLRLRGDDAFDTYDVTLLPSGDFKADQALTKLEQMVFGPITEAWSIEESALHLSSVLDLDQDLMVAAAGALVGFLQSLGTLAARPSLNDVDVFKM